MLSGGPQDAQKAVGNAGDRIWQVTMHTSSLNPGESGSDQEPGYSVRREADRG